MRAISAREGPRATEDGVGQEGRAGSGLPGASARKLSIPPPWVWYRPSWGVPVETQAAMSMAASTTVAVANGLKRKCVMSRHAPASRRLQEARLHKPDNAGLLPIWHADLAKVPRAGSCYRPRKGRFLHGRATIRPLDGGQHPGIEGVRGMFTFRTSITFAVHGVHCRFGRAPDRHSSPALSLATQRSGVRLYGCDQYEGLGRLQTEITAVASLVQCAGNQFQRGRFERKNRGRPRDPAIQNRAPGTAPNGQYLCRFRKWRLVAGAAP